MKKATKRLITILALMLAIFLFYYNSSLSDTTKEGEKLEPGDYVLRGQKMIRYDNRENIKEFIEEMDVLDNNGEINKLVYTIKNHKLEEWYYDFVYTSPESTDTQSFRWFIYDLVTNDQYCYSKLDENKKPEKNASMTSDECYISVGVSKHWDEQLIKGEENQDPDIFYATGQVISSTGEVTTYSSKYSDVLLELIDHAYIISQGEGAEGYEEAMKESYKLVEPTTNATYDEFSNEYSREIITHESQLEELKDMSLDEVIRNYDEYKDVIKKIGNELEL